MSIIATYRRFIYQLTAGVDFLRDGLGRLYAGTYGAVADATLEGVRQGVLSSLPGHPEQTADSLDQVGADRDLFKYREESLASWATRVQNAWQSYEQAGTDIQVKRAINEWGLIMFPTTWSTGADLVEGAWARFTVWIHDADIPWAPAVTYGSGARYGDPDLMYGISNAKVEDVSTLVRIVQKWKPKRSRGRIIVLLSGHLVGEPGLLVGGFIVGDATFVELDC